MVVEIIVWNSETDAGCTREGGVVQSRLLGRCWECCGALFSSAVVFFSIHELQNFGKRTSEFSRYHKLTGRKAKMSRLYWMTEKIVNTKFEIFWFAPNHCQLQSNRQSNRLCNGGPSRCAKTNSDSVDLHCSQKCWMFLLENCWLPHVKFSSAAVFPKVD